MMPLVVILSIPLLGLTTLFSIIIMKQIVRVSRKETVKIFLFMEVCMWNHARAKVKKKKK